MDKYGVVEYVSLQTGIDAQTMFSKTKQGEIANARHAVRWILFNKVGLNPREIGKITNCDRTNVYNSIDVVNDLVDLPFDYTFDYVQGFGKVKQDYGMSSMYERYTEALSYICKVEKCTPEQIKSVDKYRYSHKRFMLLWILIKKCGIPLDYCREAIGYKNYIVAKDSYRRACALIDNNAKFSYLHRYKPSVIQNIPEEDYYILDTSL